MSETKPGIEQFLYAADKDQKPFLEYLHVFLLDNGCKMTFEEKKTGLLGSYKHSKTKRTIINLLLRKQGLLVRIYGENISGYHDFLQTLPEKMVLSIEKAGVCKRLTANTCSPKCTGYDFTIGNERYQKCRYNCFEFLVTTESMPYIKTFVENETKARVAA